MSRAPVGTEGSVVAERGVSAGARKSVPVQWSDTRPSVFSGSAWGAGSVAEGSGRCVLDGTGVPGCMRSEAPGSFRTGPRSRIGRSWCRCRRWGHPTRRHRRCRLGGWCQMGLAGSPRWRGWGLAGWRGDGVGLLLWAGPLAGGAGFGGLGRGCGQARAHFWGWECRPSAARRARLTAAAGRLKSASTLGRPRTRALRPPCQRRLRWASLRSTLGRVAR